MRKAACEFRLEVPSVGFVGCPEYRQRLQRQWRISWSAPGQRGQPLSDSRDFRKFASELYAENELQERLARHYRAALPVLDLSTAVRQRFDDALVEGSDNFTTKPDQRPARLVSSDEDRAEAVYTDSSGVEGPLHLVKIGERWWFSGYTLEYDPLEDLDPDALEKSDAYVDLYAALAPDLLRRVNADEFSTIQEFWAALSMAIDGEVRKHPDRYETLFGSG